MDRITLLRHAKSSWADGALGDMDRPLNDRGRRDAPLMGQVCRDNIPSPDLILVSTALRTRETVEAFLEGWGLEGVPVISDSRLYLAGLDQWEEVVSEHAASARHILGCAHQPGLGDFACWLDASFTKDVPTAALISFSLPGGRIDCGAGNLEFYGVPGDFR